MDLYMKQKIFTWGDKFSIYDQAGTERYCVQGEVFTWGKKLHLYDYGGREVAFIQQKALSWLPRYLIFQNGVQVAEVVKEFSFFKPEYTVEGPGWHVKGDFWDHRYEVTQDGRTIADVSMEWFTLGDAYHIHVCQGADPALALAVVLVIDACIAAQRRG